MKKQSSMVSRCWIGLALVLALLFCTPVGHGLAQGTAVVINPPTSEVAIGATVTVEVRIENVADMSGAEVHLLFNSAVLEVVDVDAGTAGVQVEHGDFLSPDFVAQNTVDQENGTIHYAIAQMPPHEPVSGTGVLAKVTFMGKSPGTSAVNFTSVILSDRDGMPISNAPQGGSVAVPSEDTPTPTETPVPGDTPTPTSTPTPTPTSTPGPTPTPSATPTPGPTVTPYPTPTVAPTPTGDILGYHTVQPRETLFCIGRAYGVDPYAIAAQNGILNPNVIHPGHVLAIPNVPSSLLPGRVCPRQFDGGTPSPVCRWYHTVAPYENLYRISLHYSVSMWAIAEANHIFNLNYIRAGQVLCIP
jgi:LysM repeat protein